MGSLSISARELLLDMQSGLDADALMAKYKLSPKLFETLCARLVETGRLTSSQMAEFKLLWAQKKGSVWHCPACHMPQHHSFDECPQCGVIVSKFQEKLSREKGLNENEESSERTPTVPEAADTPLGTRQSTRQCSVCGIQLSSQAKFCTSCGTRITN